MVKTNQVYKSNRIYKRKHKYTIFDYVNILLLTVLALTMLLPIINMLITSFSDIKDVISSKYGIVLPRRLNLAAYKYVFRFSALWNSYGITIFVTVIGTLINLAMSTLAAYVLSENGIPGRNVLTGFVVITMFISGGLIPTFIIVSKLHLVNSVWALILPGAINTWNMIIMRNFFQGIPLSLKESARIDGASEYTILGKIVLPLSKPVLATMTLFYGVDHWNAYSNAIIYLNDSSKYPMQVIIRQMFEQTLSQMTADVLPPPVSTVRAATVIIATIPILCVYPFIQKYFVKGIMVGSLKG